MFIHAPFTPGKALWSQPVLCSVSFSFLCLILGGPALLDSLQFKMNPKLMGSHLVLQVTKH